MAKRQGKAESSVNMWTVAEHVVYISDDTKEPTETTLNEDDEATSVYVPAEYPVFPPLYCGPDEYDPYSWTLYCPASRRVRCAGDPEPLPTDLPEPPIVLRGYDTMRPGSPGYLPREIPLCKWWQEDQDLRIGVPKPYTKMVEYARQTYKERVPAKDGERSRPKRSEKEVLDWFNALPMPK